MLIEENDMNCGGEGEDEGGYRIKSVDMKRIHYIYIWNSHICETFKILLKMVNYKMHIIENN